MSAKSRANIGRSYDVKESEKSTCDKDIIVGIRNIGGIACYKTSVGAEDYYVIPGRKIVSRENAEKFARFAYMNAKRVEEYGCKRVKAAL